ncbi:hypothetical protein T08_4402 [Trichinella sp. T8]|nr:hypothetical protein T08_4402 [Trichinella sp. T8]
MFLTARLFRPGEAAQSKLLRNQPDSLIASQRFRPPDSESVSPVSTHFIQSTPIFLTNERLANFYLSIVLLAVTLAVGGLKYSSRSLQPKPGVE